MSAIGEVHREEERTLLRLHDRYRDALVGLDQFSHAGVLWWFDRFDDAESRGTTQVDPPFPAPTLGVFALRALYDRVVSESTPTPEDAEDELFRCWWNYRLAGDIWRHRGDPLQAHLVLNQAATHLLRALFPANAELIPHDKWLVHMSRSLDWAPDSWLDRLARALATGAGSKEAAGVRQGVIEGLRQEIDVYARRDRPDLPVPLMKLTFYRLLLTLVERGRMPLSEWESLAPAAMLNSEPFHRLVTVTDGEVVFDHDRLLAVGGEELYEWHLDVVRAVREGLV
jgi:hypothetical protein